MPDTHVPRWAEQAAQRYAAHLARLRLCDPDAFLVSPEALSVLLSRSPRVLRMWRRGGVGPPWLMCGARVMYDLQATAAWLGRYCISRGEEKPDVDESTEREDDSHVAGVEHR